MRLPVYDTLHASVRMLLKESLVLLFWVGAVVVGYDAAVLVRTATIGTFSLWSEIGAMLILLMSVWGAVIWLFLLIRSVLELIIDKQTAKAAQGAKQ